MAKSRTRSTSDTKTEATDPRDGLEAADAGEDNAKLPSARASDPPPKQPTTLDVPQELPDRTPRITVNHFVRGTRDPVLRAFMSHEKLSAGTRKLTRAEWQKAFDAFKGASR